MRSNAKGPFKAKYPNGLEYGGYRAYNPQLRKVVAIGSYDLSEATTIWQSWYGTSDRAGVDGQLGAPVQEVHQGATVSRGRSNGEGFENIDREATQETGTTESPNFHSGRISEANKMINFDEPSAKPDDVLSSFLAANREPSTSTPPPPIPTVAPQRETPVIPINRGPGRPPKKGQDPVELAKKAERNAKLAAGLKGMVTQVNIVAAGMAVKLFGRNPAEPDEAEIHMLREAWESYIDDMFGKLDVEPWVLLLIGNVMIAMSMYANGEPIPKKQIQQVPGVETK